MRASRAPRLRGDDPLSAEQVLGPIMAVLSTDGAPRLRGDDPRQSDIRLKSWLDDVLQFDYVVDCDRPAAFTEPPNGVFSRPHVLR